MFNLKIPDNVRRYALWAVLFGFLVVLMFIFNKDQPIREKQKIPVVKNLLLDDHSDTYGLETLNSKIVALNEKQVGVAKSLKYIRQKLDNPKQEWVASTDRLKAIIEAENKRIRKLTAEMNTLRTELKNQKNNIKALPLERDDSSDETEEKDSSNTKSDGDESDEQKEVKEEDQLSTEAIFTVEKEDPDPVDSTGLYAQKNTGATANSQVNNGISTSGREQVTNGRQSASNRAQKGGGRTTVNQGQQQPMPSNSRSMRTIEEKKPEPTASQIAAKQKKIEQELAEEEKEKEMPTLRLGAGAIFSGVLIAGMDAPTHESARKDPHPALMRISRETILPNNFTADFKECFVLLSGYGDISSERAYLRAESMTCIREDGGVVETPMNAYSLGEDGKAGIRGRVVSKQGQVIVRSMMAGFAEGVAEAFDGGTTIFAAGGGSQYASPINPESMSNAAVRGTGNAMGKIADYYLKLADGLFPIIEINPGREIDMILTSGVDHQYIATE